MVTTHETRPTAVEMLTGLLVSTYLKLIAAGARSVIEPQLAPPELNVLSLAVRAAVSAESLMLIVVKLGGFWMFRVPRMPWRLPALPTLTVSWPPAELRVVGDAGGEHVDRVVAQAGRDGHAGGVGVLVIDRGRSQAGDRAPVRAARDERAQGRGPRHRVEMVVDVDRVEAGRVLDVQGAEDALHVAEVAHVDGVVAAAGAQVGRHAGLEHVDRSRCPSRS